MTVRRVDICRQVVRPAVVVASLLFLISPDRSCGQQKFWVFFSSKGPEVPASGALPKTGFAYQQASQIVQPAALARRSKTRGAESLLDAEDLPLYPPYLSAIAALGGRLVHESRWANAASFFLTPDQQSSARSLPFVTKLVPVAVIRGRLQSGIEGQSPGPPAGPDSAFYGPSYQQEAMIDIPTLHHLGITGRDVLVGLLDSGFRWRAHEALRTRDVIAEHDFIFNRDTTSNESNDTPNQDYHGTLTMSVLGGYMPGQIVSPAYDAAFILAKTELIYPAYADYDTKFEEDNWAAGIEWMEAHGVDVVSSSLGYDVFQDTTGYTWAHGDFNGRTSVSALAAVRAARLGVVVCDAMGNNGNGDGVMGTMLTPADADSILSVGAITFQGDLALFSSTGPTNDGRIKPDVIAPGVGIYFASVPGPSSYGFAQGTSLATPLTAGTAALILSARPELTPIQVRDALRNTAQPVTSSPTYPSSPNNFSGWGLINALRAILSFGPIFSNRPTIDVQGASSVVSIDVVSRFGINPDSVLIRFTAGGRSSSSVMPMTLDSSILYPTSGRYRVVLPPYEFGTTIRFSIDAHDSASQAYTSPARSGKSWSILSGVPGLIEQPTGIPSAPGLKQNFPNPFNSATLILYDVPRRDQVTIRIYNTLGELVSTPVDEVMDAGSYTLVWQARSLPSGAYFCRLTTSSTTATRKLLLVR